MSADYAGCTRATLADLEHGGGGWACEPKIDGIWVLVTVGGDGRVAEVLGRDGRRPRGALVRDWLRTERRTVQAGTRRWRGLRPVLAVETADVGEATGLPAGRYVAELEALTERGEAARATHGCARLHLRDVLELAGEDVRSRPSGWRRVALEDAYRSVSAALRARLVLIERRYLRGREAREYAEAVIEAGGEGVVAHRLDAAYGEPGASRKIKAQDTADLAVLAVEETARGRRAVLGAAHPLTGEVLPVVRAVLPAGAPLVPGQVVEVVHAGPTAGGSYRHPRLGVAGPRGARLVRVRADKSAPDDAATVAEMGIGEAVDASGLPRSTLYRWRRGGRRGRVDVHAVARARRRAGLGGRRPRLRLHAGWEAVAASLGLDVIDARMAAPEVAAELRGWLPSHGLSAPASRLLCESAPTGLPSFCRGATGGGTSGGGSPRA